MPKFHCEDPKPRHALRIRRAELDVTQMHVSRRAKLKMTRYWSIENGVGPEPSEQECKRIAKALGLDAFPEEVTR